MLIIEPQVQLWLQDNPISHVAKCARVCYGNAVSKGEKADQALYDNLKKSGHLSMFRHESVYAIIPNEPIYNKAICETFNCPYVWYIVAPKEIYVSTNMNFIIDNIKISSTLQEAANFIMLHRVSAEHFANTEIGHKMMRYTFHITTQISTSRELNRVSPNNIAEKSTRYVREDGIICRPHWISAEEIEGFKTRGVVDNNTINEYMWACNQGFNSYKSLLDRGIKREDARGVLPLDTATEVVYTYDANTWKHIIELRTDKRAHPNCRIIANMIKQQLEQLGYTF